ncbi:RNI-like protein [Exidia glandulosa HHB12029]|uniref:RNI-like protein n=1 Tax=Exidia glandulosa HHB12029 TaxID=1314781 RepID=A0A165HA97_EXIGL|nr:RNI-like protein [Exidia glandulosa HHB12029]
MPKLVTVYPISASNPPSTPGIKEEKKAVEDKECDRRRRVMRVTSTQDDWWTVGDVTSSYSESCPGREDEPQPHVVAALRAVTTTKPRALDLSGIQLTLETTHTVLNVEHRVLKLVLRNCDLHDVSIEAILHALLIPCSLTFLSLTGNKRLESTGFRFSIANVKSAQFLHLSQALPNGEPAHANGDMHHSNLESLRLDDCNLRAGALEVLAHAVRTSALRNISLRQNRISSTGAVALALMIKDYPDSVPLGLVSPPPTPSLPVYDLQMPMSPTIPMTPPPPPVRNDGPIKPPPRHPASAPVTTTYTPYVPRARRGTQPGTAQTPLSQTRITFAPPDKSVPVITSSKQGGVTTRHAPPPQHSNHNQVDSHSAALLDKVRALDALPRLGALRTLDLRANEIRNGVTYIAQVLKRNRTLKVLNLSENKIDVQGLVAIAEALKYNSCLETLDLGKNPCCSPGLEGITSLRTAFTLNKSLKRLFLSGTGLNSAGAIALAEFLPESASLLHLDLTQNSLDMAGVLALSSGLKSNWTMRCLDLNIPVGDETMARLCRDILSICVRNTEKAEESVRGSGSSMASGRGLGKGVWGMIEESQLARGVRRTTGESLTQTDLDIVQAARDCRAELEAVLAQSSSSSSSSASPDLIARTRAALPPLIGLIQSVGGSDDPTRLDEMIELNDSLTALLARAAPTSPAITRRSSLQGGLRLRLGSNVLNGPSVSGLLSPTGLLSPASQLLSPLLQRKNGTGSPRVGTPVQEEPGAEDEAETKKVDKGKGRLIIEEKVIPSASFAIGDSDDEEKHAGAMVDAPEDGDVDGPQSPNDLSKNWVEEEGEVFRKGVALLKPEEMEEEYDTEELRKELLEAQVERHPIRQYDALGMPVDEGALRGQAMIVKEEDLLVASPQPPPERERDPEPSGSGSASGSSRPMFGRRSSQSSIGSSHDA